MNNLTSPIRQILAQHGRLAIEVGTLKDSSNLYEAGLTSLATVSLMLALENHFNVEFSEAMLSRRTFQSIDSIAEAISELIGSAGLSLSQA
jgi:acyl carrier protein